MTVQSVVLGCTDLIINKQRNHELIEMLLMSPGVIVKERLVRKSANSFLVAPPSRNFGAGREFRCHVG